MITNLWPEHDARRGIFVQRLVATLRSLGHVVDVEVVAQARGRFDYFTGIPRVSRRVRSADYDIVHIHFGMTAVAARFVRDVPRIVSLYGSDINVPWKRWMTRLGWGGVAARVYVSRRLADRAGDRSGVVIPNGVDIELFRPGDRAAARESFGFRDDDAVILFGAHPSRSVKGHDIFADVVATLSRQGIPAVPLILSDADQPLERLVSKFDAADVLLFTSRPGSEGSPTVVKEAIAMGLPVVTVDVGDVAELLEGVEPSRIIPFPLRSEREPGRQMLVDQLSQCAEEVLAYGQRSNGRQRAAALDLRTEAARILELYRRVIHV
jgi:teichuronic acid biosynthesis glycosyltransferase TuaC